MAITDKPVCGYYDFWFRQLCNKPASLVIACPTVDDKGEVRVYRCSKHPPDAGAAHHLGRVD